jgi:hypothetical protein
MPNYFLMGTGNGEYVFVDTEKGSATPLSVEAEEKIRDILKASTGNPQNPPAIGNVKLPASPEKVVSVVFNKRSTTASGQEVDAIFDLLTSLAP